MIYDRFSWASELPEDAFSPSPDTVIEMGLLASLCGINMKKTQKIEVKMCIHGELCSSLGQFTPRVHHTQRTQQYPGACPGRCCPFALFPQVDCVSIQALQNNTAAHWSDLQ